MRTNASRLIMVAALSLFYVGTHVGNAYSATLRTQIFGNGVGQDPSDIFQSDQVIDSALQNELSASDTVTSSFTYFNEIGTVASTVSATSTLNSSTGQLKVGASVGVNAPQSGIAGNAYAISTLKEVFYATGTGDLMIYMDLDGSYDITSVPGYRADIDANIKIKQGVGGFITGFDNFVFSGGGSSSIDEQLFDSVSFSSLSNFELELEWYLKAQLVGEGAVNLLNTANIFYATTGSLVLTPVDGDFLNQPAFNAAAVPIPAALPLLLSALGFFGFFGWRRKRIVGSDVS